MKFYEVNAILQYGYYSEQDAWEQARLISYLIAQTHSKKKLKLQDIVPFSWDEDEENEDNKPITKSEIERLKARAQDYLYNRNKSIEKRN